MFVLHYNINLWSLQQFQGMYNCTFPHIPPFHLIQLITPVPQVFWGQLGNHHYSEIGSNCYCGNFKVLWTDSIFLWSSFNWTLAAEIEVLFLNILKEKFIQSFSQAGWEKHKVCVMDELAQVLSLYRYLRLSITSESANLRSSNGNPLIKEANWDEGRRGSGGKIP